jgi:hypothetical protein
MSESKELLRVLEAGREKVTGEWGKLHNKKLHLSHSSPNVISGLT